MVGASCGHGYDTVQCTNVQHDNIYVVCLMCSQSGLLPGGIGQMFAQRVQGEHSMLDHTGRQQQPQRWQLELTTAISIHFLQTSFEVRPSLVTPFFASLVTMFSQHIPPRHTHDAGDALCVGVLRTVCRLCTDVRCLSIRSQHILRPTPSMMLVTLLSSQVILTVSSQVNGGPSCDNYLCRCSVNVAVE